VSVSEAEAEVIAPTPSRLRRALGLLLSAIALSASIWWASRQEAPPLPHGPGDLALIALAVALYLGYTAGRGWRWHTIMRWAGIRHQRSDAYGLTVVGYMANTVLPARGGEVLRIVLMGERSSARRRELLGTVITERTLDAMALAVLFAALTLLGMAGSRLGKGPGLVALGAVLLGLAALMAYLRLRRTGRLERFASFARPVARTSRLLLTRTGLVLGAFTGAVWACEALVFWLVAHVVGLEVTLAEAAFIVVLASLSALIPAAPGYVGTFDAAVLFGLGSLGIAGGPAVGCLLLYRGVIFVPVTLAGLALAIGRYGGLGRLRRLRFSAAR